MTQNNLSNFDNNGFEILRDFYCNKLISQLLMEIENKNDKILEFISSKVISSKDYAIEGNEIKYLKNPQIFVPNIYKLLSTSLFEITAKLNGANSYLTAIELHRKGPGGSSTPPHQDNFYFCLEKAMSITAYIPLNKQGPSNGGLYVYPKSHLNDFTHQPSNIVGFSSGIKEDALDNFAKENYSVDSGDLTFHHCNIVHAAPKNKSKTSRVSLALRFENENDQISKSKQEVYESFLTSSTREI